MKIEIQQEELQKALQTVASVVPAKTTMPILTSVLVEVGDDEVRFSATNLDISVMTGTREAIVKEPGRVAVPAAKLFTFVRNLPPGPVNFQEQDGKVSVFAGKASLEEPAMNAPEFPALPELREEATYEIAADRLAAMVRNTSYCVSRDETRPALMGILWEIRPDSLTLVATDAHRLARCSQAMDWEVAEERDLIVDTQGLLQFTRLAESEEKVAVFLGQNQLSFRIGSTTLHTRLLEGPFPDYDAVIPKDNDRIITVDRDQLAQAIRRVSITADRITNQIKLGIESGNMELSATGTDGSHAEDTIEVGYEGDALDVGFNFSYLQDILKNLSSDNVKMALKDPQSAALVEPVLDEESDTSVLCLLMPLRLTGD